MYVVSPFTQQGGLLPHVHLSMAAKNAVLPSELGKEVKSLEGEVNHLFEGSGLLVNYLNDPVANSQNVSGEVVVLKNFRKKHWEVLIECNLRN